MGLMLSIIVSCVGVLELFAFYTNVRRAVTAGEAHPTNASDLSCITESYIRDLNRERNKLLEEIRRLENSKEIAVGSTDRRRHEEHVSINTNSDLAPIKEKHVSRIFPTYTESHPIVVTDASEVSIISEPSTFHRESSPFPTYDRIAPRHSICSELVENPVVSVHEIDEEDYRSRTSSAMLSDEYFKSNFDSPQYWRRRSHSRSHSRSRSRTPEIHDEDLENKEYLSRSLTTSSKDLLLNVPNLKSSKCTEETKTVEHISVATEFVEQTRLRRSESPFQKIVELQPSSESEVTVVEPEEDNKDELDKNVLNSVDGLKTKQIEEHRRQFKNKKKGKKNEVVERTQEVAGPSSSGSNPEPFWVKRM